jgi:hypothetical protein
MKPRRFPLFVTACAGLAVAQTQPGVNPAISGAPQPGAALQSQSLPTEPPPGLEEALRERIRPFYQAYVDGKFRKAYEIVADDSKEAFLTEKKPHYAGFEIRKVVFSNDYTRAAVTTEIHTALFFFGVSSPEKSTEESSWKVVDGQWYWCAPGGGEAGAVTSAQTILNRLLGANPAAPSGATSSGIPMTALPPGLRGGMPAGMPGMPAGMPNTGAGMPSAGLPPGFPGGFPGMGTGSAGNTPSAAEVPQQPRGPVALDKDRVELQTAQAGTAVLTVRNSSADPVHIGIAAPNMEGLSVTSDKKQLATGESATITVSWHPAGTHAQPQTISCGLSVTPIGLFLPFVVSFR